MKMQFEKRVAAFIRSRWSVHVQGSGFGAAAGKVASEGTPCSAEPTTMHCLLWRWNGARLGNNLAGSSQGQSQQLVQDLRGVGDEVIVKPMSARSR